MDVQIQHDFGKVVTRLLNRATDYRQPLTDFYGWMIRRTQLTFSRLGRKGNTAPFRETLWCWFAPQYTRKDGTVVPAEGGIPKVHGIGMVKGRLRHSGTRVTSRSMIVQDRGSVKQAALARLRIGNNYLIAETPIKYAKYQQKMRPFAFMIQEDIEFLRKRILKYLTES